MIIPTKINRNKQEHRSNLPSRCNAIDVHEILNKQIYRGYNGPINKVSNSSSSASNSSSVISTPNNVTDYLARQEILNQIGFYPSSFLLDSQFAYDNSSVSKGQITFDISVLNNNNPLSDIVEASVGSFYFPQIPTSTNSPDFYYFQRVYLQLTELPITSSIIAPNNVYYHFEFQVQNNGGTAVLLTPIKERYFLQYPLSSLSSLTMQFYAPLNMTPIPIPLDNYSITSVIVGGSGTSPAQFTITGGDTTAGIGAVGTLTTPVAVYITGFISSNGTLNNQINSGGLFITEIINSTTFAIGSLDFTSLTNPHLATMEVGKNRFAVPLSFTSMSQTPTNYSILVTN